MSPLGNYQARPYKVLTLDTVQLVVRQHPEYAVVTPESKEKMRRPVDPPPIVQLDVHHHQDPTREFLVNPFLFMTAGLVEADPEEHGIYKPIQSTQIIGQNVSSLHRLKDINNKDGGFFVFGDISCRQLGEYRMQFNLFDFDKTNNMVAFVASTVSEPFRVVSQKEFKGLSESTHLSRTFSDQGVRLRLRKEPRTITGSKRSYDTSPPDLAPTMHQGMYGGPVHDRTYGYETPMQKRPRSGSDHTNYGSASSQYSGPAMSQYPVSDTGTGWAQHPQQPYQQDPPSYSSLAPHLQPQTGPNSSYQRYIQPDAYSTNAVGSGGSYYFNNSRPYLSMPRFQSANYTQQPSQSYESRTSRDAPQALPSLQTSTSIPDSSLVSNQSHNFYSSTPHTVGTGTSVNTGLLPNLQMQQDQDQQRNIAQYGYQSLPIHTSNQGYQTNAPSDSIYGQNAQQEIKYGQNTYQSAHNTIYSESPGAGALSDSALPLDNGMLNRSFAPADSSLQQPVYGNANGQGIDGFKQEPAPYPTPNQTETIG